MEINIFNFSEVSLFLSMKAVETILARPLSESILLIERGEQLAPLSLVNTNGFGSFSEAILALTAPKSFRFPQINNPQKTLPPASKRSPLDELMRNGVTSIETLIGIETRSRKGLCDAYVDKLYDIAFVKLTEGADIRMETITVTDAESGEERKIQTLRVGTSEEVYREISQELEILLHEIRTRFESDDS